MNKRNKKGFTLVELVVVIAIIGVLAAILIPTMMNYVKKSRLRKLLPPTRSPTAKPLTILPSPVNPVSL